MRKRWIAPVIAFVSISTALSFAFTNCSRIQLEKANLESLSRTSAKGEFCVAEPGSKEKNFKFLFVVDKSGSNNITDPGGVKRATSIENFFNQKKSQGFIYWSLITFQDLGGGPINGTRGRIGAPDLPVFVQGNTNSAQILEAIGKIRSPEVAAAVQAGVTITDTNLVPAEDITGAPVTSTPGKYITSDSGLTPYGAALALANRAIDFDLRNHTSEDATYMVIFLSDGEPTDITDNPSLGGLVKNIVDLKPGKVFFSSAFYTGGTSGTSLAAIDRLSNMANRGGGRFVNFENNSEFKFDDLIVTNIVKDPYAIRQFVVYNATSAICANGKYGADSDGDGICDDDEIAAGLNPQSRWSGPQIFYDQPALKNIFQNYGDYYLWRYKVFGELPPACLLSNPNDDDDYDLVTNCEERYGIVNPSPTNPPGSSYADSKNPDSDLDGFIDGIETFVFRYTLGSALNNLNVFRSEDLEPETAGAQILQHRNPSLYDPTAPRYDTMVQPTGINDKGQLCYKFTQQNLQLYPTRAVADTLPYLQHNAGENVIMLYYVMVPQKDYSAKGIYRYSFQKITYGTESADGTAGLDVNSFEEYVIPSN